MKHLETNRNISTSQGESFKGSIMTSGKVFSVFYDGLYSDKISSIVRENLTNAWDSHVEAGKKEEPIEIHLPTALDPQFKIKDNGIGMSHEFMTTKYTMVGFSTKDQDNISAGKWGFGRISPLSYVDSYNVVSRHNGTKWYYIVFKNDEGAPEVKPVYCEPTDECNGVEVSFPVNPRDSRAFEDAARYYFRGLEVTPKVNIKSFRFEPITYSFESDLYAVKSGSGQTEIKMGCVIYPLDFSSLSQKARSISNINLIVDVPIGSVEVTASREDLSYNKKTIEFLNERFEKIADTILEDYAKEINKAGTIKAKILYSQNRLNYNLKKELLNKIKIDHGVYDFPVGLKGYRIPEFELRSYKTRPQSVVTTNQTSFSNFDIVIFIEKSFDDKDSKKDKRVWDTIKHNYSDKDLDILVLKYDDPSKTKEVLQFLEDAKDFDVKLVSELDPPPKVTKVSRGSTVKTYKVNSYGTLEDASVVPDKDTLYLKRENGTMVDMFWDDRVYNSKLKILRKLGFDKEVYVVNKTHWPKFKDSKLLTREVFDLYKKNIMEVAKYNHCILGYQDKILEKISPFIKEMVSRYKTTSFRGLNVPECNNLCNILGWKPDYVSIKDEVDRLYLKYPFLKYINNMIPEQELKELLNKIDGENK